MTDGRAVVVVGRLGKRDLTTSFHANEDEPFAPLRDAKVRGVKNAPIAIVAQCAEAFGNLGNDFTAFVCRQSDDVFQNEGTGAKEVYEIGELLKEAVARVVLGRGTEWANRREALAGRATNNQPQLASADFELRAEVFATNVSDVFA